MLKHKRECRQAMPIQTGNACTSKPLLSQLYMLLVSCFRFREIVVLQVCDNGRGFGSGTPLPEVHIFLE